MCKCKYREGMEFKIGDIPVDPCLYKTEKILTNCTVELTRCKKCGHYEISWYRTAATEEVPEENWDDVRIPYHD